MQKPSPIIVILVVLGLSGCAASPWSAGSGPSAHSATSQPSNATAGGTATAAAYTPADAQQLQNAMAELRQWGTVDPAAQDRLMEDLRQSDPAIWPLVIEQFRATMEYRRRAAERGQAAEYARRLPPIGEADVATAAPTRLPEAPAETAAAPPPNQPFRQAMQASYAAPAADDWRQSLARTVAALEAETPDAAQRAAEAQPMLAEAMAKLSKNAPLTIRNPTFCTEVLSFGNVKRFDKCDFLPNQEVLLYTELENFASEPTQQGFHTSLRSNCQILDGRGVQIVKRDFAATEDYCQTPRRDFFVAYRFRLPRQIAPGTYALRLSIEDLKSRKSGQASIRFTVKEE